MLGGQGIGSADTFEGGRQIRLVFLLNFFWEWDALSRGVMMSSDTGRRGEMVSSGLKPRSFGGIWCVTALISIKDYLSLYREKIIYLRQAMQGFHRGKKSEADILVHATALICLLLSRCLGAI